MQITKSFKCVFVVGHATSVYGHRKIEDCPQTVHPIRPRSLKLYKPVCKNIVDVCAPNILWCVLYLIKYHRKKIHERPSITPPPLPPVYCTVVVTRPTHKNYHLPKFLFQEFQRIKNIIRYLKDKYIHFLSVSICSSPNKYLFKRSF